MRCRAQDYENRFCFRPITEICSVRTCAELVAPHADGLHARLLDQWLCDVVDQLLIRSGGREMGLKYEDLDKETRRFMVEEIEMDIASDRIYRSSYLNQRSQGSWPDYILGAARNGSDETLATQLRELRAFNQMTQRQMATGKIVSARVPHNAPEVLAESEFNRYYARGLSRRAVDSALPRLQVYRAKQVANPRRESEEKDRALG